MTSPLPLPVERAIRKLGHDISLARRRRRISQVSLAERMDASLCNGQKNQAGLAFSNTARSLCNSACNSASEGKNAR